MSGTLTCPVCSATNAAEQRFCTTCGAVSDAKAAIGADDAGRRRASAAIGSVEDFGSRLSDARRASLMARPDVVALMS